MEVKPKVLIVAYYWPPAGGPGVQRWLKFVKYLPEFGVEPWIIVPKNASYPLTDKDLVKDVASECKVIPVTISEPNQWLKKIFPKKVTNISSGMIPSVQKQSIIQKIALWVRGNFFIPDARIGWVTPVLKEVDKLMQLHQFEALITTGPPHSLHLVGLKFQQKNPKIRWIADFRDPWTTIGYHQALYLSEFAQKKHLQLEKEVLQKASEIIVTSQVTKKEFFAKTKQPIHVLSNGYELPSFTSDELKKYENEQFTISYIGSWLTNRNPIILWEVLQELIQEQEVFAKNFRLQIAGKVSEDIVETIKAYGLQNHICLFGYVSHQEARAIQATSKLLLLIEIDSPETKCIIPGKLFEYLSSQKPIIALGPKGSDVQIILEETKGGNYFYYSQKLALKTQILHWFEKYQKNENISNEVVNMEAYHRRNITKKLAEIISEK
jgi:glycosyltransferase involved in cell wall biosynthesis